MRIFDSLHKAECILSLALAVLGACSASAFSENNLDRLAANCDAGKQKDCAKLLKIAKTDPAEQIRAAATALLTDERVLSEIAKLDTATVVRGAAVRKLENQSLLAETALSDSASSVAALAASRLTDRDCLQGILEKSSDPRVREVALQRHSHVEFCALSPWILSDGLPLVSVQPGVGVEVLEFSLDGTVLITLQGIYVGEVTYNVPGPGILRLGRGVEARLFRESLSLRMGAKEGVYVRTRDCNGERVAVTCNTLPGAWKIGGGVNVTGGTLSIMRKYCPNGTGK